MKRMLDQKQIDQLSELLDGEIPNEKFKALIESLGGTSLKVGIYIYNEETDKIERVEELPENYTGIVYYFGDDQFELHRYENGVDTQSTTINATTGVSKLDFASLTHSFNELDPTIKALCESAITDDESKPCSPAQWEAIKSLLDKSLYFNYDGYSMIKCIFNGIDEYTFGEVSGGNSGFKLSIYYDITSEQLTIAIEQV